MIYARRLVAQKCLYGIDRNPMAVDLAKVSMWLSTLARDHPLTFVDHAFRHGDSLVGLTRQQIEALHWKRGQSPVLTGFGVQKALEEASALRRQIREADDTVSELRLQNLWRDAQDALIDVRLFGDLVLAGFFEGSKPKERESRLRAYQEAIVNREPRRHAAELEERRNAEMPFAPFHWEIEFPEVFERENPGFDGFVGNPPFLGGKRISTIQGRPVPRLAGSRPRGIEQQHRHCGALLSARIYVDSVWWRVGHDRHQHHRPRRHACRRVALDLRSRRSDLPRHPASPDGLARRRWWSAYSIFRKERRSRTRCSTA